MLKRLDKFIDSVKAWLKSDSISKSIKEGPKAVKEKAAEIKQAMTGETADYIIGSEEPSKPAPKKRAKPKKLKTKDKLGYVEASSWGVMNLTLAEAGLYVYPFEPNKPISAPHFLWCLGKREWASCGFMLQVYNDINVGFQYQWMFVASDDDEKLKMHDLAYIYSKSGVTKLINSGKTLDALVLDMENYVKLVRREIIKKSILADDNCNYFEV